MKLSQIISVAQNDLVQDTFDKRELSAGGPGSGRHAGGGTKQEDIHKSLASNGWKKVKTPDSAGLSVSGYYKNKDNPGHTIVTHGDGQWIHFNKGAAVASRGGAYETPRLNSYLKEKFSK